MQKVRYLHRFIMLVIVIFLLNFSLTGIVMQVIDVKSYLTNAPGTDPSMISLRESYNGPPNFEVIRPEDYEGRALPTDADLNAMIGRAVPAMRAAAGTQPIRYVELRMTDGKPELLADVKPLVESREVKSKLLHLDPVTGRLIREETVGMGPMLHPFRNTVKGLHSAGYLQFASPVINFLVGLGLLALIVTGLIMYFKLLKARQRLKRNAAFWKGGGWWRQAHRWVSIVAAVFIMVIAVSGTYISFEGLFFRTRAEIYKAAHGGKFEWAPGQDASSPLTDAELPAMLNATLAAHRSIAPGEAVKVVRLRHYSGMPQGVVVSGEGKQADQYVFDTSTGRRVTETEPGYAASGLPLGWHAHQLAKQIHRGDYLALPGSTVSGHLAHLLAGLALLYLSVSGIEMYYAMWKKRAASGRRQLSWK